MTTWRMIAETIELAVHASTSRAASLIVTRPRALGASPVVLLREAITRFAPHVAFPREPVVARGHTTVVAMCATERIEVGVVARGSVCLAYVLASDPAFEAQPWEVIDHALAGATSPFAHWIE